MSTKPNAGWTNRTPVTPYSTGTGNTLAQSSATNNTTGNNSLNTNNNGHSQGVNALVTPRKEEYDVTEATRRMLEMTEQTKAVADSTQKELDQQREGIKKNQDQAADMNDALNVTDRKLRGIKSFFSNIGNSFKKDKSTENKKARQKYEKEFAKEKFREEEERVNKEEKEMKEKLKQHDLAVKNTLQNNKSELKAAQNSGGGGPNTLVSGKFVFQEVQVYEKCEAEKNLDLIGANVSQLKEMATTMGSSIDESQNRLNDLNSEMNRVQDRTKAANAKALSLI